MGTRWAVRLQPSGVVSTVANSQAAHELALKMAVCDGVTAAEVVSASPGASATFPRWEMRARYLPEQFDKHGNFIKLPEGEPKRQEPEATVDRPR